MYLKLQLINQLQNILNKGFFHLLLSNVFVGFLSFGIFVTIAKFLSPIQLGQIKAMQSFNAIAIIFSGLGFNIAVLKLCSEKRTLEEKEVIFKKNFYYTFFTTTIIFFIIFILSTLRLLSPDKVINKWMSYYAFIIPASAYTFLIIAFLQSQKRIKTIAKVQAVMRTFGFFLVVLATYFYGFSGYITSAISVAYIAIIPFIYLIKNIFKHKQNVNKIFLQSFYYGKWSVLANGVKAIGDYLDIFLLNYFIKDRVGFGYYSLATIFILGINQITITTQSIAAPYFSEKCNNKKDFFRVLFKYEKLMLMFSMFITITAISVVPPCIKFVYGIDYAPAGGYFRILAIKYFFWSCYALFGVAIFGIGKIKYNVLTSSISVFTSGILMYFLIKSYGLIGAAVGQIFGSIISLIFTVLFLKYALNSHFSSLIKIS